MNWTGSLQPVSKQEVEAIEWVLGVKLPDDYLECAMVNHGGRPSLKCLDFAKRKDNVFQSLLPLTEQSKRMGVVQMISSVTDRLPGQVIPFGNDPGGNLYCFDYRRSPSPRVVYWDHELAVGNPPEAIVPVAESFTELLGMLHGCEE